MKNINGIINALLSVTLVFTALFIVSCDNSYYSNDAENAAKVRSEAKSAEDKQKKETAFFVQVTEIDLKQIELGQLAQRQGKAMEVRDLGRMVANAHTKSLRDLTAFAQIKGMSIPESHNDYAVNANQKLTEKFGDDFDRAFVDKMVSRHREAIDAFEEVSAGSEDKDFKSLANSSLLQLREHLDLSLECQKKFSHMYFVKNNYNFSIN